MQTSADSASRWIRCDGQALTPSSQAAGSQAVQGSALSGGHATQVAAASISASSRPRTSQGGARGRGVSVRTSVFRASSSPLPSAAASPVSQKMPANPSRPGVQNSTTVPRA